MKKVAFVTGGTRGIGLGISLELAKEGFDLAINGIREEIDVSDVLSELKTLGSKVVYCQGDISIKEDRERMLETIKNEFNTINILINNAGVAPKERNDILKTTSESFDFVVNTNLKGTFFLTQAFAKWMIDLKNEDPNYKGKIINITSISATVASVNRGEYCISKAGLGMVTQLFAVRLGEFDIPVYEIRPGIIKTDMTSGVTEKYDDLMRKGLFLQSRWGMPEDIGKAVSSLAKGDFLYSTGQIFVVDGGITVARL